ncbi:MAG: type I methionyl aminopeptidase [Bacteroidetes bacterium]|nr:type I methionyl aminopeptidase [Bacteroidota bacterium]MCW5896384.1 type I methionyl aminopeptidase [Bacteroidota bacterium]
MGKVPIKSPREIELIRESSQIVAEVLALVGTRIKPGVDAKELDEVAERFIRSRGGTPAFKGYGSDKKNLFPSSLCISIDEEVVHGIPNGRKLEEGQIVSIDVGVRKNGYYGDSARTFAVGRVSEEKQRLMRVTEESLYKGIEKAVAGNHIHDVSFAVQKYVEANGYSVVRDLVGHGVGKSLHEEPAIPNYGDPGTGVKLKEGMVLAIEPMVNAGTYKVEHDPDGWTVRTVDRKPSAHFEHTVVVRKGEAEILTR